MRKSIDEKVEIALQMNFYIYLWVCNLRRSVFQMQTYLPLLSKYGKIGHLFLKKNENSNLQNRWRMILMWWQDVDIVSIVNTWYEVCFNLLNIRISLDDNNIERYWEMVVTGTIKVGLIIVNTKHVNPWQTILTILHAVSWTCPLPQTLSLKLRTEILITELDKRHTHCVDWGSYNPVLISPGISSTH